MRKKVEQKLSERPYSAFTTLMFYIISAESQNFILTRAYSFSQLINMNGQNVTDTTGVPYVVNANYSKCTVKVA